MQQVAARNCLHGAASAARAGISVLEELFWNAAARSVRFAASFAAAACICMQIARVPPRERDGLGCVACDTRSDAAMHNGYMLDRIHGGSYAASNTCRGLCESTRLCQTVGCRMEVGFLMGGLLVIAAPVVVLRRTHAWGIGPRGRANGMAKSPPPPLRRRRRKGFHTTVPARRRGEGVVAGRPSTLQTIVR